MRRRTYHQGDTVKVSGNVYYYNANISASIATSAVPTDTRFDNLTAGGSTPVQTHTNYIGLSPDNAFSEAEFLAGNSTMTMNMVVPTFTSPPNQFIGIAVPDDEGDIADIRSGGISTFGGFVRIAGTININSVAHKVWRTIGASTDAASGTTYVITQA